MRQKFGPLLNIQHTQHGWQDARIHVSEPDFEVLTQGGLLVDSSIDGGITIVEFERIIRAQLTLHVQAYPPIATLLKKPIMNIFHSSTALSSVKCSYCCFEPRYAAQLSQ